MIANGGIREHVSGTAKGTLLWFSRKNRINAWSTWVFKPCTHCLNSPDCVEDSLSRRSVRLSGDTGGATLGGDAPEAALFFCAGAA